MASESISDYLIAYDDLVLDEIFKQSNENILPHLLNVTILNALEIMESEKSCWIPL